MSEDKRSTDDTALASEALSATEAMSETGPAQRPSSGALPARYQLGSRLGAGGMGEVLLATDQQLGRDVAIKRMRVSSAQLEMRFFREAKIQGKLDHPGIVPVHELASDSEGNPFFVMKRVTGTTLADMMAREGAKFSREKLLRAFAEVCLAVEFAHSRGIVHRDLKPANIMLGDFGEVYVLDWGIARVLAEADDDIASTAGAGAGETEVGAVIGTLGYMSPEQLRGQTIDGRSDVFALGCILFEIIGGQPLLPRSLGGLEEAFSTIVRRASGRARIRDMAPELVALCVEATHLELDKRMKTARELGERVEKFLDGDRDVALRKELAATHTEAARKALAGGDGETERATAMKEAGRAIALDPTGDEAVQLITRLMVEPPSTVPTEVEQRLAVIADTTSRRRGSLVALFALGFLLFLPMLMWMGISDSRAVLVFSLAVSFNGFFALMVARRKRPASVIELHVGTVFNTIVTALIARMFSPFLVAPGIAAVSVMMFLSDPRIRAAFVIPMTTGAVLVPWLLETAGVLSATTATLSGSLVLSSPTVTATMPATAVALALYVTLLVVLSGLVSKQLGDTVNASLRSVELQAWHLRKLVAR